MIIRKEIRNMGISEPDRTIVTYTIKTEIDRLYDDYLKENHFKQPDHLIIPELEYHEFVEECIDLTGNVIRSLHEYRGMDIVITLNNTEIEVVGKQKGD